MAIVWQKEKETFDKRIKTYANRFYFHSENMQQIQRKIPMPKCDFSKLAKQVY